VLDARQVFRARRRGTGKNLIDLYETLARRQPGWEFRLVHREEAPALPLESLPNVKRTRVDIPGADRFNLWEQVRLPLAALTSRADVLHAPANTGPRFPLAPMVVTIHDLIPLEISPDSPASRLWLKRVRAAARAARRVVTPSEYSKRQIVEKVGVPPEKVTVNHWAADRNTRRVNDPDELGRVRRKYGLAARQRYVFGFGASDPRKNTRLLIEAYARLPRGLTREVRLLLIGIQGAALAEFRALAGQFGVGGRAALHDFADEADLPALLSGADVLCFPSRSDGFGLLILDAFQCETAVVTGNRTSLPEVAGDAAVLVDPDDVASIRDGLAQALSDEGLRRRLAARGRERLRLFTWERCADAIAQVFEEVGSERRRPRAEPARAAWAGT
jgi:glycosyltransferase involved in cell wall biosynthesis